MRGGRYQRHGQGLEAEVVECKHCGLIWSDPFPIPADPSALYGDPAKYFAHQAEAGDADVAYFRTLVQRAAKLSGRAHPSVLDVGSGRGQMLRAAKLEGCDDVIGLELASGMIDYAATLGITVLPETVEHYAARASRTFDFVCLSAIIEHVYDPDSMVAAVEKLTHPGSVVYVDAPNERSLMMFVLNAIYRLRRSRVVVNLSPTWPPFHLWGFSEKSLTKLLAKHSFDVTSVSIYSEMGLTYPRGLRGAVIKAAAKTLGAIANRTNSAANIFVWATRR